MKKIEVGIIWEYNPDVTCFRHFEKIIRVLNPWYPKIVFFDTLFNESFLKFLKFKGCSEKNSPYI
jgi:hypothetical protein